MEGKALYKYKNGDIFKGTFIKGKKKFGSLTFNEGKNKYEGYFENDKFSGEGILNINGEEKKGIFKDGILIEKKDKVKFESENVINENGINIQIKHDEDDWEIATIKQSKYRHSKVVYKKGSKIIEEKKEELKDDNNIKKQDKNDIEIKINNDK